MYDRLLSPRQKGRVLMTLLFIGIGHLIHVRLKNLLLSNFSSHSLLQNHSRRFRISPHLNCHRDLFEVVLHLSCRALFSRLTRLTLGGKGPAVLRDCKRITPVPCDCVSLIWPSLRWGCNLSQLRTQPAKALPFANPAEQRSLRSEAGLRHQ